jgi:hypothetical protein
MIKTSLTYQADIWLVDSYIYMYRAQESLISSKLNLLRSTETVGTKLDFSNAL